jgi:hypothetical protein
MRSIAERLVSGSSAAAQPDGGTPGEPKLVPVGVLNREIALEANRTVIENDDFCWHSF